MKQIFYLKKYYNEQYNTTKCEFYNDRLIKKMKYCMIGQENRSYF